MCSAMNSTCASAAVHTHWGGSSLDRKNLGELSLRRTASDDLAPVLDRYTNCLPVDTSHSWKVHAPAMSELGR